MKVLTLKIFIILSFIILTLTFKATVVSAQSAYCNTIKGQAQRNAPANHIYNGFACTTPGDFNNNKTCKGATGSRFTVYYCVPFSDLGSNIDCINNDCRNLGCEVEYPDSGEKAPDFCNRPDPGAATDISRIFGQIQPPQAIQNFGFGAAGISKFLTNLIALIYILAAIVLIFMLLWGAFDWITSGGDKEKVHAARERITQAFIGIILFAAAFAVIAVLGQFTGFKFFVGQP